MRLSSKLFQILSILRGWDYEAEVNSLQCRVQLAAKEASELRTLVTRANEGHASTIAAYKELDANLAATQIALVETEDHNQILKETIKALRGPEQAGSGPTAEVFFGEPEKVSQAVAKVA